MADVQLTFGAKIDDLVKAVNDVKSNLDDLKGKFDEVKSHTESISTGVNTASSALKAFAVTLLAAFSIEGIATFAENMAALGEKIENIKYSMGLSSQSVVELAGVAKLTGTSIDQLTSGIERMALNIQRATRDSTNPFAQALKNLGLSTKDFIGLNGAQYFEVLSKAVSKFNPDMNLTTNLMQLGGRAFKEMIPALIQGQEAFEKYRAIIIQATQGLAAAAPGMADTKSKLDILSLSVDGLRARIFTALKPAIDAIIERLGAWARSIDSETIVSAVKSIANAVIIVVEAIGNFIIALIGFVEQLTELLTNFKEKAIGVFRDIAVAGARFGTMFLPPGMKEAAKGLIELYDGLNAAADKGNADLDKRRAKLKEIVDGIKGVVEGITSTLGASGQEGANKPPTGGGRTVPPLTFPGSGGEALAEAQRQIGLIEQQYQMAAEKINHDYKMTVDFFGSAEAQKTQALIAAVNERMSAELGVLEAVQAKYAAGSKEYQRIEDEKTKIIQKAALDRQKIENQAAEQSWQKWKSASDSIASTFSSGISSMVTGGKTFSQAMAQITRGIIDSFISMVTKMAFEWVAKQLFMSTATKAVQATDVASTAATETAKTAAVTGGVAARTSAEAAGASANIFTQIGQAISFIFTQAAKTFAGVFAFLSPAMGPAAAGPAAASEATVMAQAATIGAFAQGTDYVHKSGLAIIHEGEQIVPAQARPGYTGANAGGAGAVHNWNIQTVDPANFARWLKTSGGDMVAKHVAATMNRNPSLRPVF